MAKLIAVYNYKGGVGKTTNVINLASVFARLNENVLLVDADPQCNLTTFYFPVEEEEDTQLDDEMEDEQYNEDNIVHDTNCGNFQQTLEEFTVKQDKLNPKANAYELEGNRNFTSQPSIYSALLPIYRGEIGKFVPIDPRVVREKIWLLPGSPMIVRFEKNLGLVDSVELQAVPWLGAFRRLLLLIATKLNAKVVLIDLGPSSGILNKTFVMSCDYILPPSFADYFSLSSGDGLLREILPQWILWHKALLKRQKQLLQEDKGYEEFAFHQTPPKLLPFIVTAYKTYGGTVTKPSSGWILNLRALLFDAGIPKEVRQLYFPLGNEMVIPLLGHVGQLLQHSHSSQTPFLEFDQQFIRNRLRERPDTLLKLVKKARDRYDSLCGAILCIINNQ